MVKLLPSTTKTTLLDSAQRMPMKVTSSMSACSSSAPGWAESSVSFLVSSRSEEHTSELQSLMRISYAVFCLKKKKIETCKRGSILLILYPTHTNRNRTNNQTTHNKT